MFNELPISKYSRVWIKKRKNNPKSDGSRSISYTLEWLEFGRRHFFSLGKHANLAFARQAQSIKERELNSPKSYRGIEPITWDSFVKKYLAHTYPGHDADCKC